jgi:hypothetical protein
MTCWTTISAFGIGKNTFQQVCYHFDIAYFRKLCVTLGATLTRKYKAAIHDRNLQVESHQGFTSTIAEPAVKKWGALCAAWDETPHSKSVASPYDVEENCKF